MGLAKQIVISNQNMQLVAAADVVTKASDTQGEFYD